MHAWLKRAVAGLLSAGTLLGGGLLTAGTANADEIRMPDIGKTITSLTASAATTYPRELVNGGFDYLPAGGWNVISPKLNTSRGKFTSVDPVNGQYIRNAHVTDGNVAWVKWDGFDASKFGWISDQKGGKPQGFVTDHANSVELQRDNDTDNTYAEIVGSEIGKSIYQKIDTQSSADAVYTVRFDHAALSSEHADGMQALVNGKPVTMTRIGGNKAGDKTGWTGTDIVTHATNTDHYRHDGQWATYEGKVTIPANTPVSTFMFKSLNEEKPDMGNLIDNLTFKIAYRLSYDSNGGTKAKASQISSMTEGEASETDGKVRTVADENVRYGSLANGDFSYPSFSDIQENEQGTDADLRTFLKSDDGTLWYNMSTTDLSKYGKIGQIPGFDSSRFAWSSTENGSRVELQQDRNTKNTYAEIVAQQDNTSIYQNVSTSNGGVLYKIRLKHASRQSSHADKMQVLVGSDTDHATPVEMTRVTSNGHGDKVGGKSTTITTKVSNTDPRDHGSQWETYEGYYQVPEGQKNTVFMFKSLEGFKDDETLPGNNVGNLVDDIEFSRSYKLTYDKNASDATGKVPSNQRGKENTVQPAESKTTGNVKTVADNTSNLPNHLVNGTFDYRGNEIINENQRVYGQHDTTYLAIISAKTGVTGFNDLDGFDARPDLKFEGVQLLSGFDGAYRTRDAELASYGTNGYAGIKHDAGDESNLNGAQQVRHRLAATWTGPTFTYSYDLENPTERTDGVRMTFGMPVTRTQVLTYKANGGTGQVPSRTEAGKTETAASRMNGTVRLAADRDTEPESGTTTDDRKVLTDTIARQDDGTSQRTITRSDGSVQVQTIADTGAVSGCQVYYPAGAKITLATAKADSDCWDSSQISKTNRTFYGWSANTDANDKDVPVADTMDRATLDANAETQITMPARAKTVYALWAINPTLTYNVNAPATTKAPDAPASITVPYNTAADDKSGWTVGDTGKITGYSFDGWYTSPTGGDKYDWSTKLTNDVTMYAHWTANGYTVKYDAGGGKGTMGDQKFTFDVPQNLSPNAFTRDGYTFTGWKRADTGDAYQDGQQVANLTSTPNGIVTMIAQWTPNPASINYDPNPPTVRTPGGQGTANWTGHTGDTQAIGANGWTVDGYTFIGWNTSADGKGTAYAPGTTWIANGTLTLYAQWTPGQAGLTYDGNGATGGKTDPQPGKTDEKINVRDNGFTRDGYMFVTWNTQAGCKGKAVNPGDEWTLQGSSTLYACWAGTAQTLTYHGNGATGGNTAVQSGKTGDELTTNANGFTRDGYTFVRWDTAKDGSGTAYGEGKNGVSQYVMKPAGNDLYAIWKANPATIQYRNDWPNTTGSTPDTTGNTGDTVTISQNSFDRPGYTFTGWSTSKRGDPSLQPGDKHTLEPRTTTVWAQWKADPAHLVYNSNIGTVGSETKTVDGVVDQTVKTITNPFDRPGYTFSGWNTQADGKGKAYATGADYVLTANDKSTPKNTSVLYAQWKINGASLKFNPNGGIGHVDDVTGDAFSTVTIPGDAKEPKITRPGYRFVGWSTEKNPPAGSTFLQPGEGKVTLPAEGSTTVYAQWEPSLTTLPFTGGQAQVPTIWLYAGFALMLIALGVMMPMLRTRMAATKRTGKHMPITGGKHAK